MVNFEKIMIYVRFPISFIILLVMLLSHSFAQTKDTINRVDENNLKQGYWIKYDETNKEKIEEGWFSDDKKDGIWKSFYSGGKIKSEITYVKGRPNGYSKFYYENGNVSEEGIWKGNKWVGEYKYYFENGNPSYEWNYNDSGKRTGQQKYFHENGKIMIEGEWQDGKESGTIKEYYEDGTLKSEKSFDNGKLDIESVKNFSNGTNNNIANNSGNNNSSEHSDSNNAGNNSVNQGSKEEAMKPFDGNGFHKLYKSGNLDREGEFRDFRLINGKRYYYDEAGALQKTNIYKGGKVIDIIYAD